MSLTAATSSARGHVDRGAARDARGVKRTGSSRRTAAAGAWTLNLTGNLTGILTRGLTRSRIGRPSRVHIASRLIRVLETTAPAFWRIRQRLGAAWTGNDVERERPLVVSRRAAIRTERCLGALAPHAHDSAHDRPTAAGLRRPERRRRRETSSRRTLLRRRRLPSSLALRRNPRLILRRHRNDDELSVLRHRILVFLAKEPAVDQRVDTGWERVRLLGVLATEERDGARVLLAAEHQLGFLFAPRLLTPYRHGNRHQNGHDGQHDEQRGHGVTLLVTSPRLTT
jgi:hypothetical protein